MTETMLKYLLAKLLEPSTHRGLAVLAAAAGLGGLRIGVLTPELFEAIATVAGIYIGLVEIVRKERAAQAT